MTQPTFQAQINAIPFNPATTAGGGYLPPLMRAYGHVLFLLACVSDDTIGPTITPGLARGELLQASGHFTSRSPVEETVSAATIASVTALENALETAGNEIAAWSEELRRDNLRELANRFAAVFAILDCELVGLPGSDPGAQL